MEELKNLWLRQDGVGRTVLVTGLLASLACLVLGRGILAVALMAAMGAVCVLYARVRCKRLYEAYGVLYYRLPDGEEAVLPLEAVEKRHLGREVILRCPYDGVDADGDWVTGFGLVLDMTGCDVYPRLQRGEMMEVRGLLAGDEKDFYLAVSSCIAL